MLKVNQLIGFGVPSKRGGIVGVEHGDISVPDYVTFDFAEASEGDIALIAVGCVNVAGVDTDIGAGWVLIESSMAFVPFSTVYYKELTASDITNGVEFYSTEFNQDMVGSAVFISGYSFVPITHAESLTVVVNPNPPSISVIDADLTIVVGIKNGSAYKDIMTAPTGYELHIASDNSAVSAQNLTIGIATKEITTTGTEDPDSFSGGTGAENCYSISVTLNPI